MKKILIVLLTGFVMVAFLFSIEIEADAKEMVLPIFVPNYEIADNLGSETEIFPIYRTIDGKLPITDTIRNILEMKIDLWEKALGFESEWDSDHNVELVGVNLKEGLLKIELSDPDDFTQGGSYRVRLLRAQIEKTVKQFESVEEVEFLPETLFQP